MEKNLTRAPFASLLDYGSVSSSFAAGGGEILTADSSKCFDPKGKLPSQFTLELQNGLRKALPFQDQRDFEKARKGFVAAPSYKQIMAEAGNVAWDMSASHRWPRFGNGCWDADPSTCCAAPWPASRLPLNSCRAPSLHRLHGPRRKTHSRGLSRLTPPAADKASLACGAEEPTDGPASRGPVLTTCLRTAQCIEPPCV